MMLKKLPVVLVLAIVVLFGCDMVNPPLTATPTATSTVIPTNTPEPTATPVPSVLWDDEELEDDGVVVGVEYMLDVEIIKSEWLAENNHSVASGYTIEGEHIVGLVEYGSNVLKVGCTYRVRGSYLQSVQGLPVFVVFDTELLVCEVEPMGM